MRVFAFVGPSGTGKSYRAQMVAGENSISYIIDDGLLINENEVVAGESAKKAPTKIETVKHAIFIDEKERKEMVKAIKKYKPESILILGTSDGMVEKIAKNLELPEIQKTIYIQEVATKDEMETARNIRITQGKHVIPVPTFEIKKDFSGYILDPLQIFKSKGNGNKPYISEKSIIRPTFSYLGNFTISDTVFRQIVEHLARKEEGISKIIRTRIENIRRRATHIHGSISLLWTQRNKRAKRIQNKMHKKKKKTNNNDCTKNNRNSKSHRTKKIALPMGIALRTVALGSIGDGS